MMYRYLVLAMIVCMLSCKQESADVTETTSDLKSEIVETKPYVAYHTMNELLGKFNEKNHTDFVIIPTSYTDKTRIYLRKEVLKAYEEMKAAADKENINLLIRSATRNFEYQKGIWEAKWNGTVKLSDGTFASDIKDPVARAKKILQYSSMPGSSRHHWGTDIDLNAFNNAYFDYGDGKKEFAWLTKHAASYGFHRPYTEKGEARPEGYNEERWHWSYLPIAKQFTDMAQQEMTNDIIKGFAGDQVASEVDMVKNYVLGIDPSCL